MRKGKSIFLLCLIVLLMVSILCACKAEKTPEQMLVGYWVEKYKAPDQGVKLDLQEDGTGSIYGDGSYEGLTWRVDGNYLILHITNIDNEGYGRFEIRKLTETELTIGHNSGDGWECILVKS